MKRHSTKSHSSADISGCFPEKPPKNAACGICFKAVYGIDLTKSAFSFIRKIWAGVNTAKFYQAIHGRIADQAQRDA
jgi:hypothetical protein